MSPEPTLENRTPRSRVRIEAISDGVFAIALTLLILNVKLNQGRHEPFSHAFRKSLPELLTYALSFAVISLFWIGHHRFFASLRAADHGLVLLNFTYLAVVALVPFPSQVLGNANGHEAGPVVLYAAVMLVASAMSALMWLYARHRGLIDPATPSGLFAQSLLRSVVIGASFAISIPIALFVGAHAAEWSWLIALPGRLELRRRYGNLHDVVW